MTTFIVGIFSRLKTFFNFDQENNIAEKRRRDSFEDSDNEYLEAREHKRAKWNIDKKPCVNMEKGSRMPFTSKGSIEVSKRAVKENVYDLTSDDDDDVEIITPIRADSRPPLSPLPAQYSKKHHPTSTPLEQNASGRNRHNDNGRVSAHLRLSKNGLLGQTTSISKARSSALNESIRLDEKRRYSMMLNSFFNNKGPRPQPLMQLPKLVNQYTQTLPSHMAPQNKIHSVHVIDLTKGDDSHIPVQQHRETRQRNESAQLQRKKVERVNSFEEKLKSYDFIAPEWIKEMQKKYGAREREKRKEMSETLLVKKIFEEHNKAFNDALTERLQKHLAITEVVLDETKEEVPALPTLTPEMEQRVKLAFIPNPANEVLSEGFGQRITRRDIHTLSKLNWLNDEVINFYMNLLIERGKSDSLPSIYAFNTFFYPKLSSVGHSALKRWTKKVDIFAHSMIIVPVHLGMHWCLAVIDFRDRVIKYYDSMGGSNNRCLSSLLKYLEDESLDKKKQPYDTQDWKLINVKDIPQQMNGSDCGMFSCMFAEFISRNASITFTQDDMPYFRRKMTYEILSRKLLT